MDVASQQEADRAAWLEQRKQFITASDAAALLGLNSSKSARAVREVKAGLRAEDVLDEELLAQVPAGRHLEAGIAAWFLSETPHVQAFGNGSNLIVSPVVPFLAATPDWIVDGQPVEIKLAGETQLSNWFDGTTVTKGWPAGSALPVPMASRVREPAEFLTVSPNDKTMRGNWRRSRHHQLKVLAPGFGAPVAPLKYWVQLQVQMHVMSADSGWIVGCVGGTRRIDLLYERDVAFERRFLSVVSDTWLEIQKLKGCGVV